MKGILMGGGPRRRIRREKKNTYFVYIYGLRDCLLSQSHLANFYTFTFPLVCCFRGLPDSGVLFTLPFAWTIASQRRFFQSNQGSLLHRRLHHALRLRRVPGFRLQLISTRAQSDDSPHSSGSMMQLSIIFHDKVSTPLHLSQFLLNNSCKSTYTLISY